jgi:hypothetical protein
MLKIAGLLEKNVVQYNSIVLLKIILHIFAITINYSNYKPAWLGLSTSIWKLNYVLKIFLNLKLHFWNFKKYCYLIVLWFFLKKQKFIKIHQSTCLIQNVLLFCGSKTCTTNAADVCFWIRRNFCQNVAALSQHNQWRHHIYHTGIQHNGTRHNGGNCDTWQYFMLTVAFFIVIPRLIIVIVIWLGVMAPLVLLFQTSNRNFLI